CGTGAILSSLARRARLVIGVDGSSAMLDLCRSRISAESVPDGGISLRIGELTHLPLADREANFACINLVLHHLSRPQTALAEIRRVLETGGVLFVADFEKHNDETMRLRYGDQWLGFTLEELEGQLEKARFKKTGAQFCPVGRKLSLLLLTARAA
ncbi:MAG: class I SAM-dependent methyltransferase, partial [Desulfovibrio sp.]|nr:class I SAM-dependent methyltransferase [Desulfovibrio sp.]